MKLLRYFENLLATTVNLNQSRLDLLDERVAAIENYFQADEVIGAVYEDLLRQGSYAHRTIIRPQPGKDFDSDVLLQLAEDDDWQPCDYIGEVYQALRRSERYRDIVDRKTHCVTIDYRNDFHIDVVPYVLSGGVGYVVNRKTNEFELTNPEGFNAWLDEKNRIAMHNLVKVIRLLKYLRDTKRLGIKSVILTTLVGEQVEESETWADPDHYGDVPTALKNIAARLDRHLQAHPAMPTLADPSCPSQSLNHRWDQAGYETFRDRFHDYATKIEEAYADEDREASIAAWQELFGTGFCLPQTKAAARPLLTARGTTARDTEQFLDRPPFNIPFERSRYRLQIVGRAYGRRGFRDYDLPRFGNQVPKRCKIRFRIVTCDVPGHYDVFWKVKNDGAEATAADQLRGEIQRDQKGLEHSESTLYRGSHYVECYVVKDGRCVARDTQRVIIP